MQRAGQAQATPAPPHLRRMIVQPAQAPRMFLTLDNLSTTSSTSMYPILLQVTVLRPKYVADCNLCHSLANTEAQKWGDAVFKCTLFAKQTGAEAQLHDHHRDDACKMTCCGAGLTQAASMGCGPTTATRALTTTRTTAVVRPLTSTPLLPKHSKGCTKTGPAALGVRGSLLQNLHRLPQTQSRRKSLGLGIKYLPR